MPNKPEVFQGWLLLDGKATFVKCCYYLNDSSIIRITVPRRHSYRLWSKKALSNTKAVCLRRAIKDCQEALIRQTETLGQAQREVDKTTQLLDSFKEQLRSAITR